MKSISEMIMDPLYAAIIGAVIGLVAKMIDHRMSDTKGTLMGYLKSMAFCAGLLALWTFVSRPRGGSGGDFGGSDFAPPSGPSGGGYRGMEPRRMTQPFARQGYQ